MLNILFSFWSRRFEGGNLLQFFSRWPFVCQLRRYSVWGAWMGMGMGKDKEAPVESFHLYYIWWLDFHQLIHLIINTRIICTFSRTDLGLHYVETSSVVVFFF